MISVISVMNKCPVCRCELQFAGYQVWTGDERYECPNCPIEEEQWAGPTPHEMAEEIDEESSE